MAKTPKTRFWCFRDGIKNMCFKCHLDGIFVKNDQNGVFGSKNDDFLMSCKNDIFIKNIIFSCRRLLILEFRSFSKNKVFRVC